MAWKINNPCPVLSTSKNIQCTEDKCFYTQIKIFKIYPKCWCFIFLKTGNILLPDISLRFMSGKYV